MIKVYKDTKVFVHCPAGVVTGGAELLHQVVHILRVYMIDAYIVYYGDKEYVKPSEYSCYDVAIAEVIDDCSKNIEIIYEGIFKFTRCNKHTQKFLWWLSVDHFYIMQSGDISLFELLKWNPKMGLKAFLRRSYNLFFKGDLDSFSNKLSLSELRGIKAMHGYQSEYAQNFLQNNNFGELVAMKDYINTDHIAEFKTTGRENIVLYNPKKGLKFTKKLIASAPDLKWIAVQNMSRSQLVELMRKAKLYIDFGYHPGKDRLPRECAMNGCCVITNKCGSANFFEDVAIADEYKFDQKHTSKEAIIKQIRYTIDNYESSINDFAYYRNAISHEKEEFVQQVVNIFCNNII